MNAKELLKEKMFSYKVNVKSKRGSLILGLLATGHSLSPDRCTGKYLAFGREDKSEFLFVGKSAALRKGPVATKSISLEHSRTLKAYLTIGQWVESLTSEEQARNAFAAYVGSPVVKSTAKATEEGYDKLAGGWIG